MRAAERVKPLLTKLPSWTQDVLRPAARLFEKALDASGFWQGTYEHKAFTAIGVIGVGVTLVTLPLLYGTMALLRRGEGGRLWIRVLLGLFMALGVLVGLALVPLGCGLLAQVLTMKRGPLL